MSGYTRRAQGHSDKNGEARLTVYELWLFRNHCSGSGDEKEAAGDSKFLGLAVRPESREQRARSVSFSNISEACVWMPGT